MLYKDRNRKVCYERRKERHEKQSMDGWSSEIKSFLERAEKQDGVSQMIPEPGVRKTEF